MSVIIPTHPGVPAYTLRALLSDVEFVLTIRFNERDGAWYMDLADALNVPIVSGRKIVIGFPLIRGIVDLRRPRGNIVAIDTTNTGREATTVNDLGDRVVLVYGELDA